MRLKRRRKNGDKLRGQGKAITGRMRSDEIPRDLILTYDLGGCDNGCRIIPINTSYFKSVMCTEMYEEYIKDLEGETRRGTLVDNKLTYVLKSNREEVEKENILLLMCHKREVPYELFEMINSYMRNDLSISVRIY